MAAAKCPICNKLAPARANNPAAPFCSRVCKLVDLGKWLGEGYRLPTNETVDLEADPKGDDVS